MAYFVIVDFFSNYDNARRFALKLYFSFKLQWEYYGALMKVTVLLINTKKRQVFIIEHLVIIVLNITSMLNLYTGNGFLIFVIVSFS